MKEIAYHPLDPKTGALLPGVTTSILCAKQSAALLNEKWRKSHGGEKSIIVHFDVQNPKKLRLGGIDKRLAVDGKHQKAFLYFVRDERGYERWSAATACY